MTTKKPFINPKKLPYYIALTLLTVGASLILGFLSFGGMYAIFPMLSLAIAAFTLSVAYEGEIYLQNIKGAFNKLFKRNYLKNHLGREYLLEKLGQYKALPEELPAFFKDYEKQLKLLDSFGHKTLNKDSKKLKKKTEKTLKDMEKWFALQLFADDKAPSSPYAEELRDWLTKNDQDKWQATLTKRKTIFHLAKAFSLLSASFMGLGSTYLIVESFSVIPVMAAIPFALWPIIIIPMAIIAGAAYGMLTYNTLTDLINNDTFNKWYKKIRDGGLNPRNVFVGTMAVLLVGLAIALTICTAGTWWTVATKARPLFEGMRKMPSFVMGVINPIIIGISAVFFNIENTAESMNMLDDLAHSNINQVKQLFKRLAHNISHLRDSENWLQILNPFRILFKLIITPLRVVLFIGHLISIALTADRMPGVPQIVSALIAIISEGFEDAHYFIGHSHECHGHTTDKLLSSRLEGHGGHNHDADIPTKILKILATPLYALAASWDYLASKMNKTQDLKKSGPLTFAKAWAKQLGLKEEVDVRLTREAPSTEWKVEHTVSLIQKYLNKTSVKTHEKEVLTTLEKDVRANPTNIKGVLDEAMQHRDPLFKQSTKKTCTESFLAGLAARVSAGG